MTQSFPKLEACAPVSPCWIVRQVGSSVEAVHVGTSDVHQLAAAIAALIAKWPGALPLGGAGGLDLAIGVRIPDGDSDAVWRELLAMFGGIDSTCANSAIVLLTLNRIQYVAVAKRARLY
jgi:hypothetical protein